ncbi:MAG: hypothetical protein C5B51_05195 [Terriglobia bacterium]|nr:MAG: hypothetical protein C5B51_05195 [Terriglobia bacterium]
MVASELAQIGRAAIPDIELALDSVEQEGTSSKFFSAAGWLVFAYSRIQGPSTVPWLTRMIENPKLASYRLVLDHAVALSLGLTSYVSSLRNPEGVFICRRKEPRDALDQLVLSWEQNDRSRLELALGTNATKALNALLTGQSWESMRSEIWTERSSGKTAVGYLFDVPGRWSEPEETLVEVRGYGDVPLAAASVGIETRFKNDVGLDCATHRINFRKVDEPSGVTYQIDNSDLKDLLRSIAVCATG